MDYTKIICRTSRRGRVMFPRVTKTGEFVYALSRYYIDEDVTEHALTENGERFIKDNYDTAKNSKKSKITKNLMDALINDDIELLIAYSHRIKVLKVVNSSSVFWLVDQKYGLLYYAVRLDTLHEDLIIEKQN